MINARRSSSTPNVRYVPKISKLTSEAVGASFQRFILEREVCKITKYLLTYPCNLQSSSSHQYQRLAALYNVVGCNQHLLHLGPYQTVVHHYVDLHLHGFEDGNDLPLGNCLPIFNEDLPDICIDWSLDGLDFWICRPSQQSLSWQNWQTVQILSLTVQQRLDGVNRNSASFLLCIPFRQ